MSDVPPTTVQRGWSHDFSDPVIALAWSREGHTLAVGTASGRLGLLGDGGRTVVTEAAHTGRVESLAFNPCGEQLVSAGEDGWLRCWHPARRGAEFRLELGDPASRIVFRPDGARLAVATGRRVLVADRRARLVCATVDQAEEIAGLAWALGGRRVVLTAGRGGLLLFDGVSGRRMGRCVGLDAGRLAASGDGTCAVVEDRGAGVLRIFQITADRPEHRGDVTPETGAGGDFALSDDGRLLAVCGEERAELWNVAGEPRKLAHREEIRAARAAFAADGRLLALADRHRLELCETGTGRPVATIDERPGPPAALGWTRRARRRAALAVATDSGQVDVFDVR